jgi:hypothetical protein
MPLREDASLQSLSANVAGARRLTVPHGHSDSSHDGPGHGGTGPGAVAPGTACPSRSVDMHGRPSCTTGWLPRLLPCGRLGPRGLGWVTRADSERTRMGHSSRLGEDSDGSRTHESRSANLEQCRSQLESREPPPAIRARVRVPWEAGGSSPESAQVLSCQRLPTAAVARGGSGGSGAGYGEPGGWGALGGIGGSSEHQASWCHCCYKLAPTTSPSVLTWLRQAVNSLVRVAVHGVDGDSR